GRAIIRRRKIRFDDDVLSAHRRPWLSRVRSRSPQKRTNPAEHVARRGSSVSSPRTIPLGIRSAGLDLDLDVDARGQLDALQAVDGLCVGIDDVDQALVDTHLKVLA